MSLSFWHARAFKHCDLAKGGRFVEPMCNSNGLRMSSATAQIINRARNDVMCAHYGGGVHSIDNPYPYSTPAAAVYADVVVCTIGEDRKVYG